MLPGDNLTAPAKLSDDHNVSSFDSGEPSLDDWLKRLAHANELSGGSRTFVVCDGTKVVGYYALANGSVAHKDVTAMVRQNMPTPIPVMLIGRLAVDKAYQNRGIGRALLRDAILRTMNAAQYAGIRAILVHAISENAKTFYQRNGFYSSPVDENMLMITVNEAKKALGAR